MNTRSVRAVISWRQAKACHSDLRTTPRSGQSRASAKAGGPANTLIEAAGADPFGDCQVEGSLIGALRACGNLDAALSRAEAASRERPADTLIKAVHLPVRRAAVELRGNRPANAVMLLEEARAFERRYTEVLYLRGLAYLTMRESVAAATEFRKIIDHKGATWAALRAGPALV